MDTATDSLVVSVEQHYSQIISSWREVREGGGRRGRLEKSASEEKDTKGDHSRSIGSERPVEKIISRFLKKWKFLVDFSRTGRGEDACNACVVEDEAPAIARLELSFLFISLPQQR